jgi:predicted 2-oxoglutarate/Fe(II)-dependent dioxygenase YbiX
VVFACSHLHEVTHVTQGRRFTLLSFLFGDADVRAAVPEAATSSQPS